MLVTIVSQSNGSISVFAIAARPPISGEVSPGRRPVSRPRFATAAPGRAGRRQGQVAVAAAVARLTGKQALTRHDAARRGRRPLASPHTGGRMRITLTSVLVDDQDKALRFYTDILGFRKK